MKDEKVFGRIGLNLDDDPRYFGVNDTDLIQNMLPNVSGDAGVVETYGGNVGVATGLGYAGDIRVVGTCKDVGSNYVYMFMKAEDPLDGNTILQYDPISETYRKIVFEDVNLIMGDHVYGAVVFGDYLIYNTLTDGLRKVHIDYANRYYSIEVWSAGGWVVGDVVRRPDGRCYVCILDTVLGDGAPEVEPTQWAFEYYTYPSVDATTFVLRNMPPVDRPTIAYGTDATRLQNNLIEKTFQFAYRYKYVDGGYSVYSEYSDIALPPHVETFSGNYVFELFEHNKITISFTRGELAVVEYVELVVREGNDGEWKHLASIEADEDSFVFYNDENYESVDQDSVAMLEDAVPRVCADMALINENRLVEARVTEGFDNIVPDVSMFPVAEAVTIVTPVESVLQRWDVYRESLPDLGYSFDTSNINHALFGAGDVLRLRFGIGVATFSVDYTLLAGDVSSAANLLTAINGQIGLLLLGYLNYTKVISGDAAAWNTVNDDDNDIELQMTSDILSTSSYFDILDGTVTTDTNKWNTYKSAATHPHGIEYFDQEFRHSSVQRSPAMDVYVAERGAYSSSLSYRVYLGYAIAHLAPSWAKYWRWVYAGNKSQSSFVQYVITGAASGGTTYAGYVEFDITPLQTIKTSSAPDVSLPNSIIDPYVFSPGDRVRVITGAAVGAALGTVYSGSTFFDLPISELDTTSNKIRIPAESLELYGAGANSLIEIYTPRSFLDGSESYFGVGDINTISTPGYHSSKQRAGVAISAVAAGGTYGILVTTSTNHGLVAGDWVRISGTTNYNGDFIVKLSAALNTFELEATYVSSQTGTATPMAYGFLYSGDAYLIARAFSENVGTAASGTLFPVESMHYSDFYLSDVWDRGKINVQSLIGEVTQNNIRWGLRHLSGASVNNMFTFDALDYKTTTEIYGDLERIGECGDVLRLIFNKKVASMYIGKTEYIDTEGSSVVATSNNVLSNPNYSIDDFGTTVPEAVLFVRGVAYFIDLYSGAIVRSTNNGSYPISGKLEASDDSPQYKMSSYFRDICNQVLDIQTIVHGGTTDGGVLRMMLGWDDGRKLLYVSMLHENIENRTLAFSEDRGRWVAFLDFYQDSSGYYPTAYEWISGKFLSFLDGNDAVYDHSSPSATPLMIYDEDKLATISVWSVVHPNKTKVFDSIAIHTNVSGWYGSVFIPPSLSYPAGMESRLFAANFKKRENALYTEYMFNGLSAGSTFSLRGLYNGESLRGYVINNRLSIVSEAQLFKVDVNYRISNV